ncbi:MAG: hypothetical protein C0524_19000 [Rhodobacter sp.]|nr:hypothetical protein [Rhodobacter sp.]
MRNLIFAVTLLAAPAHAACPNDSEIFSCTIDGKPLRICHWRGALIYNFGPVDKPELSLSQPLQSVQFTPRPGMGGSIWESVAFPNQGYTYEVWTSIELDPEAVEGLQGGINVLEADALVTQLTCDPGTPANSLDIIYELKQSIGQCRDHDTRVWTNICD